jgi:hypothetical protein
MEKTTIWLIIGFLGQAKKPRPFSWPLLDLLLGLGINDLN